MYNLNFKYFFIYILIINLIGFLFMYIDKKRAINHQFRISENTLLLLSILGGSIGSFIGMYKFRHKTKKKKFTVGIPLIFIIESFLIMQII
ncbi:DUF1294 domain-containing protein [Romboutsia lituseburensis]|uniref:Uncharacterized membrane protein YsdA, DUF1294 family n=1 Tax=Romboutsia lituseburensis DSM 797 TaxID=1121325 RepID=A0A1G9KTN3_9FIRM|nr:DUF1294 domain-containing protein [Romboutsia lituseburensis]CEH35024.1 Protein of unknown function (DUF1294) [Romboutsia lituseburensis]SDL52823.1 Uncharacterized membrane protein YsdA, DUF1294 family [Romboutsia lituseburensis DSM 797]